MYTSVLLCLTRGLHGLATHSQAMPRDNIGQWHSNTNILTMLQASVSELRSSTGGGHMHDANKTWQHRCMNFVISRRP